MKSLMTKKEPKIDLLKTFHFMKYFIKKLLFTTTKYENIVIFRVF